MSTQRAKPWIVVPVLLGLAAGPAFGHTVYRYNPAGQPRHKRVYHVHRRGGARAETSNQNQTPDILRAPGQLAKGSLEFVGDLLSSVLNLGDDSPQAGK